MGVVPDADGFTDETADDRLGAGGLLDEDAPRADVFRGSAYGDDAYGDDTYDGDVLAGPAGGEAGGLTARIRRRSPGSLEAEILNVLHTARRELSPAQVRERLASGATLSYSAVVTTLTRLHGKGVVTRRRAGRAFLYLAESDAASLVAWRMNRLLDEQADHRPALTHFVAALSPGDEALIRQLLGEGSADQHPGAGSAPSAHPPAGTHVSLGGPPAAAGHPSAAGTNAAASHPPPVGRDRGGAGTPAGRDPDAVGRSSRGALGAGDELAPGNDELGPGNTAPRGGRRGTGTGRAPTGR